MITQIIKQLQSNDWYNVSENVEIAKGRYKLQKDYKGVKGQFLRVWRGKNIYK
jgi:hypothetical protein